MDPRTSTALVVLLTSMISSLGLHLDQNTLNTVVGIISGWLIGLIAQPPAWLLGIWHGLLSKWGIKPAPSTPVPPTTPEGD